MPEEGRARSPVIRSISSKDLRRSTGRKSSSRGVNDTVTFDVGDRTTEAEDHLLQDLDEILHRKLHIADSGSESGGMNDSPSSSSNDSQSNNNNNDIDKEFGDEEDYEEDEDFANVDEIDGPISPSSSTGSLKELGRNSTKSHQAAETQNKKIDYNLPVDDSYQRQLDRRAEEISNGLYTHPVSKATLKWSMKDFYSLYEEIPDWFCARDYIHLEKAQQCFEKRYDAKRFLEDDEYARFTVEKLSNTFKSSPLDVNTLLSLLYIATGLFASSNKVEVQISVIKRNSVLLLPFLPTILEEFKKHAILCRDKDTNLQQYTTLLFYSSTIIFFLINFCIENRQSYKEEILKANKDLDDQHTLKFLTSYIEHWRWSSRLSMRIRNMIILLHKVFLLQFGDMNVYRECKNYVFKKHKICSPKDKPSILTVSPLDYHAFREDVTSRFPSFVPPPSTIPKGFDNSNSLSQFLEIPRPKAKNAINLNLSVPEAHIATPAPSPSTSPVLQLAGTKLRKSFQTNMAYPSLYPSDDEDGSDDLTQIVSVPEDGDNDNKIPFNVKEATEILSKSIYVKLSTKQLWHERELFMIQERGWEETGKLSQTEIYKYHDNCEEASTMRLVEDYYEKCLPSFSSLVYVLLQTIESSVSNQSFPSGELSDISSIEAILPQLEVTRSKEIVMKSACAILYLLLKWFKLSHILKFEHLCVLLYDFKFINISTNLLNKHSENYSDRVFDKMVKAPHSFWKECSSFDKHHFGSIYVPQDDSQDKVDLRFLNTEFYMLNILGKVIGKKTQRLKELPLSIGSLFKKYYQVFNLDLYHPMLKITRELTPFKNKKWKSDHMELISGVYLYERLKLTDNWVTGKDISGELNDACGQEIALRALLQFYNFTHYKPSMEHFGYHDKSDPSFFCKESELLTTSY